MFVWQRHTWSIKKHYAKEAVYRKSKYFSLLQLLIIRQSLVCFQNQFLSSQDFCSNLILYKELIMHFVPTLYQKNITINLQKNHICLFHSVACQENQLTETEMLCPLGRSSHLKLYLNRVIRSFHSQSNNKFRILGILKAQVS